MIGILEEFAVCLAVSLGLRAIGVVAQFLSAAEKTSAPRRRTCAGCDGRSEPQVKTNRTE
jgi:hypothetical protein